MMSSGRHKLHEENPYYGNQWLWWLDSLVLGVMHYGSANYLFSCFVWTTQELKTPWVRLTYAALLAPIYLIVFLCLFPLTLTAFLIWLTFQHRKMPYRRINNAGCGKTVPETKATYGFATINICLLAEFLSRFNNSSDNMGRAHEAGRRIVRSQVAMSQNKKPNNAQNGSSNATIKQHQEEPHTLVTNGSAGGSAPVRSREKSDVDFDHSVLENFPELDVLLIQEVWILRCARVLAEQLVAVYPHIVYDAGYNTWTSNRFLSNSGLLIASRYPILDVQFDTYSSSCFACTLAAKGLLQVKLDLGVGVDGRRRVGFAANTHLQAYQGTAPIHTAQLDEVAVWTAAFRQRSVRPDHEDIVFDVLGGDFNTDNLSPVDKPEWNHRVFTDYYDPGRIAPGKDHSWTVGTEMRHRPLHDEQIETPSGLKRALEDPLMLQYYILDGDALELVLEIAQKMPERDQDGCQLWTEVGGRRRIDYVMHRRTENLKVIQFSPVAQLAGLTDHIPYTLTVQAQ